MVGVYILILGFVKVIILLIGLIIWRLIVYIRKSPQRKQRRILREIAERDYQQARGSAHLLLLKEARARLSRRLDDLREKISGLHRELDLCNANEHRDLENCATRYIVENHLHEVAGIGEQLREQLLRRVFRSRLEDLRHATHIPGVGIARQQALDTWVTNYRAQMPRFLQSSFPGKDQITSQYATVKIRLQAQLDEYRDREADLVALLHQLEAAIRDLDHITIENFRAAVSGSAHDIELVERYLCGAFAEWQPMPDWFEKAVFEEKDDGALAG